MNSYTAQVITVSTRAALGVYEDRSGKILAQGLSELGYSLADVVIVSDEPSLITLEISRALSAGVDLIVTTGGTGVSPSDVTPEATAPLIEKLLPGF